MKKFALVGTPISHSKSPALFAAAYNNNDWTYSLFETSDIHAAENALRNGELQGVNITAPLKIDAIAVADELAGEVREIGATNTIVVQDNETLKAYNTDMWGVMSTFRELKISARNKKCLVLGAGGASMAAVYAMKQLECNVTIVNRTLHKAKKIATKQNCNFESFDNVSDVASQSDIIINTLPPTIDEIDETALNKSQIILDASYIGSPLKTKASRKNIQYIDGRYWLLYQACACFSLFTNKQPDVKAMKKVLSL